MRLPYLILMTLLFAGQGCNESEFGSSNGTKAAPTEKVPEEVKEDTPKDCVEGDQVNFNWTGEIKTCLIDEGRTYNFDKGACTEMRKAKFDCNWDDLKAAMKKINLVSQAIEKDSGDGAKLISCGQSKDGNRIVAQWVKIPKGEKVDCNADVEPGNITTGCYVHRESGDGDEPPKTKDEQFDYVFDCMNEL